jgi:hypothetical protein
MTPNHAQMNTFSSGEANPPLQGSVQLEIPPNSDPKAETRPLPQDSEQTGFVVVDITVGVGDVMPSEYTQAPPKEENVGKTEQLIVGAGMLCEARKSAASAKSFLHSFSATSMQSLRQGW